MRFRQGRSAVRTAVPETTVHERDCRRTWEHKVWSAGQAVVISKEPRPALPHEFFREQTFRQGIAPTVRLHTLGNTRRRCSRRRSKRSRRSIWLPHGIRRHNRVVSFLLLAGSGMGSPLPEDVCRRIAVETSHDARIALIASSGTDPKLVASRNDAACEPP
jgi:hypothetical protein